MTGRRLLLVIAGIGAVIVIALQAFAWRPAVPPVPPPAASSFPPELVAQGEILANAGNCVACHTVPGGRLDAGGRPFDTPFGTFYSTNITPDPETGIGGWSEAAFRRALREGVARSGRTLFPVFPYVHFTLLTDPDMRALYAYVMTRPPVTAANRDNAVSFPLDVRALQAVWKEIYLRPGPYRDDPRHDAQWNRGAYLAEGLAACGACHTPRNAVGAERRSQRFGGAMLEGWIAPPLDAGPSPTPWSQAEIAAYLRTGNSPPHGVAVGPMRQVVKGLVGLPDSDIVAIAAYIASLNRPAGGDAAANLARAQRPAPPATDLAKAGQQVYRANCADCHDAGGPARSPLGLNASLWLELGPHNFLRTVLDGIDGRDGLPGAMPGFRGKLGDEQLAALAAYLREQSAGAPAWPNLDRLVPRIRIESMPQP